MTIWAQCLEHLKRIVNERDYDRWIEPIAFISWNEEIGELTIGHRTLQANEATEKNFGGVINAVVSQIAKKPVSIQYQTQDDTHREQPVLDFSPEKETTEVAGQYALGLRPQHTFDSFVAGTSNQLAFVAAQNVGDNPGKNYNPLFIYGGVGLGKTHLMHAVGNRVIEHNPQSRILCISAQTFMNDFTEAVRSNNYAGFDNKYQNVDSLFIDDIQYLCGDKRQTQNKLFDIFEKLVPNGKQIIFTSDTYARSLKDMDERLISRFTSGLSVEVEPPELETRVAILQKKASAQNFDLADDVAYFIAKNLKSNVRELEGALNSVIAFSTFRCAGSLSVEMAREALQGILIASTAQLTIDKIQGAVSEYFKISLADLYSKTRMKPVVTARHIGMYLCKELTNSSLKEIGEKFGKRDHTTVIHAVKQINSLKTKDKDLNYHLHVLEQMLKN